ncbi:MAG: DUF4336 domain-containing protein [Pseudomonadales bacterium]|nr:DUF4336 domain-containing protein [Pseudomonadales bacterium]
MKAPLLERFGPSLHLADGPVVSFYGFPYPTRMAIAQLADGSLWVWSPIELTPSLGAAVDALGPVRHIVAPNKLHHLFLDQWAARWPDAALYASPGLARKRPDLRFLGELGDAPAPAWSAEIDQVLFRGSFALEEVVFLHRPSRTALFCDLIQRHPRSAMHGWRGALMRLDGLVGAGGSTPREWRASFLHRRSARAARARVLDWHAERLVIAHGDCATNDAGGIIARALSWI